MSKIAIAENEAEARLLAALNDAHGEIERLRALVQQHDDEVWVGLERAKDVRAATIEECARVADKAVKKYEWSLEPAIAKEIADAIRALKDKP